MMENVKDHKAITILPGENMNIWTRQWFHFKTNVNLMVA